MNRSISPGQGDSSRPEESKSGAGSEARGDSKALGSAEQRGGEPGKEGRKRDFGKEEMNRDSGQPETRRDSWNDGPAKDEEQLPQWRTIHNGSAGAFDATEDSHDDDDEYQDNDDFAMDA